MKTKPRLIMAISLFTPLLIPVSVGAQWQDEPLSAFEIIEQRNIFRPKPEEQKPVAKDTGNTKVAASGSAAPAIVGPDLILTGVVKIRSQYKAILEKPAGGKSFYVKVGDQVEDYTVKDIEAQKVILEKDTATFPLSLIEKTGGAGAAAPSVALTPDDPAQNATSTDGEPAPQNGMINRLRTGEGYERK